MSDENESTFTWVDYCLFIGMLLMSTGTGIYHGVYKKQNTAEDYLHGGKKMKIAPIATSVVSSSLSGLTLLSLPADVYRYGVTYMLSTPIMLFVIGITYYVYLPVFYKLQVTSTYEYFTIRFNSKVRIFASILYIIHMILLLPIFLFVPILTLSYVTHLSIYYITPIVCGVCIFYTTLGGLKAAVWADAIQFGIMLGSLVLVVVIGIIQCGGVGAVIEKATAGGRMDIDYDVTLLKRDTFWSGTIAMFFVMTNHYAVNQSFVQKCLSLPSFKAIKYAMILITIGVIVIPTLSMISGLVMFAKYFGCDPHKLKLIRTYDQLLPKYVIEEIGFIPGLPGLFIAGIFSASLSALSASLNCMGAVIYKDFVSPFISKSTPQEKISQYLKILVAVLGIMCTGLIFVVQKMGSLLALTISASSITGGPLLGLFTTGMLIPMVNSTGALCGGITSLTVMLSIILMSQWYKLTGVIRYPVLPVSIDNCTNITNPFHGNQTYSVLNIVTNAAQLLPEEPFFLFRISFYYYTMFGMLIVIIVSVLVSCFTKTEKPVNKDTISPVLHFLFKDKEKAPQYYSIDEALTFVKQ